MPRTSRLWLLASLFWIFITLLYDMQVWFLMRNVAAERAQFMRTLTWQDTFYLCWIPATVLIWRMAGRWDPSQIGWRGVTLRHLGGFAAIAPAHVVAVTVLASAIAGRGNETFAAMFVGQLRGRIYLLIIVYAGLAASGHAMALYNRIRDREAQSAQLQSQLAAARLETLRAQLHPHFLFNSLHAIASLVREERNDEAVRLVSGLADLLRRVLEPAGQRVRLADEIELVRRYVEIQQVRFGDRLQVVIGVDPVLADERVPALLLQPLVENAVRHAIETRVEPGRIDVRGRADAGGIVLDVSDNGPGLPANWSLDRSPGTGLRNLAARLQVLYDGRARLSVGRSTAGGALITIHLPRSVA